MNRNIHFGFLALVIVSVVCFLLPANKVFAVSASQFDPGRIIDDSIFFNDDSMSVAEIQKFLDSKMPNCDTNHAESSHWKDFGQPYICLKDYREDPTVEIKDCTDAEIEEHFGFDSSDSRYEAAKNYCWWKRGRTNLVGTTAGSSSKSAARIIWDAAQEHRINPQVLIVTLQKEQSLLTDDYPWVGQYQKAMGYACPDTADCDPQFRGFYNQVHNAARQFRRYVTYPEQYNHAIGENNVRYHPNANCGSSRVNIKSAGTAALYNYTPYQPNEASLNNYPGTGDSCSSYGNRNFWFKFHEWFGTTLGSPLFRIGNNSEIYILGANDDYYYVPTPSMLKAYGYGKKIDEVIPQKSKYIENKTFSGRLSRFARFEDTAVYLVDNGRTHKFTGPSVVDRFGHTLGEESKLLASTKTYLPPAHNMRRVVEDLSSARIYLFESGLSRYIDGPTAYNSGDPSLSSYATVGLSDDYIKSRPVGSRILPSGTLLRVDSSPRVFLVNSNSTRLYVPSPSIMDEYNFSFEHVRSLKAADVEAYSEDGRLGTNLVKDVDSSVWLIHASGVARQVSSEMIGPDYYDVTVANLPSLSSDILERYESKRGLSEVIRGEGDPRVYKVEAGEKRYISGPSKLRSLGYTKDDVVVVSPYFISTLPDGENY